MQTDLVFEVNQHIQQPIEVCYHCHKCAAGCPVASAMEYGPDRLLRMVSLGQEEQVLRSRDIWLCVGCLTCATRCPNGIDIAAVMDALRQIAYRRSIPAGEHDAWLFHRLFLGVVGRLGRSHEAVMLGLFKVLSHVPLWKDMDAGIALLLRGKVPLLPKGVKTAPKVREIFRHRSAG